MDYIKKDLFFFLLYFMVVNPKKPGIFDEIN